MCVRIASEISSSHCPLFGLFVFVDCQYLNVCQIETVLSEVSRSYFVSVYGVFTSLNKNANEADNNVARDYSRTFTIVCRTGRMT